MKKALTLADILRAKAILDKQPAPMSDRLVFNLATLKVEKVK